MKIVHFFALLWKRARDVSLFGYLGWVQKLNIFSLYQKEKGFYLQALGRSEGRLIDFGNSTVTTEVRCRVS